MPLKLKDYVKVLTALAKKYPDATLVYASDDEGNQFAEVFFMPTEGKFKDGKFLTPGEQGYEGAIDAICVN